MAHIKKLVLQGFKSFARRTEIPFDKEINVVIGPNGAGKSNLSDAIKPAGWFSVVGHRQIRNKYPGAW